MTALETIQNYGIDTSYFTRAIQGLNDAGVLSKDVYEKRIGEIYGVDPLSFDDEKQARLYFLYTVQEFVRAGEGADPVAIRAEVDRRVQYFNQNLAWALVSDEDENGEQKTDASGNPKQKKGAKKELAKKVWEENKDKGLSRKDFIALLVKEVGLTSAGASTYYSNLKAGRY